MIRRPIPIFLLIGASLALSACLSGNNGAIVGATPTPSVSPTATPTPTPSSSPSVTPTPSPSASPTTSPSPSPTPALPVSGVATDVPAGCSNNIAQRIAAGHGYCFPAKFTSFDGTGIDLTVYVPQPAKRMALAGSDSPNAASPLLIHSHGFGGVKASDMVPTGALIDRQIALDLWQAGYWVISYTQRGFGATEGQIGMMAPDKEGWDFVRLVDWAICHLRANAPLESATTEQNQDPEFGNCGADWGPSLLANDSGAPLTGFDDNVALGTIGYSYGGGFQFTAQSLDSRVDAILPMGTWHDLRFSLHPNDTPKTAWITIMTAFASSVPPLGGGNGEPLPNLIVSANTEAEGANQSIDDAPYNKARQVSTNNMNILAPHGVLAFCDDHAQSYSTKFNDLDGEPIALESSNRPVHSATHRAANADMFMMQGYGDTLFSMNEGFDDARCFEKAGRDAYVLMETSGHPLPEIGPAHYAGMDMDMYLDEIVHCGVDQAGNPVRYNSRDLGRHWFDDKLRGVGDFSATFPFKACVTQENANRSLKLSTADPYFANGATTTAETAFKWPREGATFDNVADILVGGTPFPVAPTTVLTGPGSLGQGETQDPRVQFVELMTTVNSTIMAGIPTANLTITRDIPSTDEIIFAGIAVKRCHAQAAPDQNATDCEALDWELLHFQVMPIRVFPNDAPAQLEASYPSDDPRNFGAEAKGHTYPIRFGDNPPDRSKGRLHGVTARLYPGDKVGLVLMPEHPVYTSVFSPESGSVTVSGTIELPLLAAPNPAPTNIPAYVTAN